MIGARPRTCLLAFLVPFLGVSLTFGTAGVAPRRSSSHHSPRTSNIRTVRQKVFNGSDTMVESPDKIGSYYHPKQPKRSASAGSHAVDLWRVSRAETLRASSGQAVVPFMVQAESEPRGAVRGRAPPSLS